MSAIVRWIPGGANLGRAAVCIGKFDGVHVGHRRLISETVRRASALGAVSVVVTFDRHPACVLAPGRVPERILPLEENLRLIAELRPDFVVVLPFTRDLADLPPERFVDEILLCCTEPVEVLVGAGFRFGAGAAGTAATLRARLDDRGCVVTEVPLVTVGAAPASSTRVRHFLASGQLAAATLMLGRATG